MSGYSRSVSSAEFLDLVGGAVIGRLAGDNRKSTQLLRADRHGRVVDGKCHDIVSCLVLARRTLVDWSGRRQTLPPGNRRTSVGGNPPRLSPKWQHRSV